MKEFISKTFTRIRKSWIPIVICTLITIGCSTLLALHYKKSSRSGMDLIGSIEAKLLDARFVARGPIKTTGKVGILAMDEKSIVTFGKWPFDRMVYQRAFENLKKIGTGWIGFDVVWSEADKPLLRYAKSSLDTIRDAAAGARPQAIKAEIGKIEQMMDTSPSDANLAATLSNYGQIVLGYMFLTRGEIEQSKRKPFENLDLMAPSEISAAIVPEGLSLDDYRAIRQAGVLTNIPIVTTSVESAGFFNNEGDDDAIVRWSTMVLSADNRLWPSLSLKMASNILNRAIVVDFGASDFSYVSLVRESDNDDLRVPIDPFGRGRMLINHRGPGETFPHFSLADAYNDTFTPAQRKMLKGMNLLLGPTATGINDQRANPFDPQIMGVENHAAALDNLLAGDFLRRPKDIHTKELLLVILVGLIFSPIVIFGRAALSGAAMIAFLVGYYYYDKYFWFNKGTWAYIGMPMFEIMALYVTTTFYKYLTEEKEKAQVKGIFGRCLSPDVVNQVLENPDALKLGGERKELTVFFSDVRSFTTISESLTPEQLCFLMNDYFTPMAGFILRSGGTLDKYIGDAIMAFWGAPIDLPDHADRAALACIQMLFELEKLQPFFMEKYGKEVNIGIGLNSGPMSVGMMGSQERMNYTVMGDNVNLGSRLEGLTKDYGIKAMISEFTRRKLTRNDIFVRDLDDIRVKGKNEPVNVFELMRPDVMPNEQGMRDLIGEFEAGRASYRKQEWDKAKGHFEACVKMRDKDGPSMLFLERVEKFKEHPPGDQWDGVYTFKHK